MTTFQRLESSIRAIGVDLPESVEFVRTRASLAMISAGEPSWYIKNSNVKSRFPSVTLMRAAGITAVEKDGNIWIEPVGLRDDGDRGRRDYTGMKFGWLSVREFSHEVGAHDYWLCDCARCGGTKVTNGQTLMNNILSCGCHESEPEFISYQGMRDRVTASRGKITIDPRWATPLGYKAFIEDMGPKPHPSHCICKDEDIKHYGVNCKCRWDTRQVNNEERKDNIRLDLPDGRNVVLQRAINDPTVNVHGVSSACVRSRHARFKSKGREITLEALFAPSNPKFVAHHLRS